MPPVTVSPLVNVPATVVQNKLFMNAKDGEGEFSYLIPKFDVFIPKILPTLLPYANISEAVPESDVTVTVGKDL